ncbi:GNAT family N-acetyltransferase [Paracidovorax cattleyae]|uniref:Ribosomal-protein-alanine N-acetyltransferase n=1 Tax=Paracidovorax cattleyae TaxID=80868 RepID=A0A1H0QUI1_9BURK|nr:GNAT family N-acetyltransferase [Paracidovorax cattleyae]SDP20957.1 ribosomal-protein-alanine N-acetyltransferase [Paracidovorax cattleyae]
MPLTISTAFPDIEIHTPRCLLRPFREGDLPGIFEGLSDPRVIQHYGVRYASLEATREQLRW